MDESESPPDDEPREEGDTPVEGEGAAVEDAGESAGETAEGETPEVVLDGEAEDPSGEEPSDPADEQQVDVAEEEGEVFVDGEVSDPTGEDEGAGDGEVEVGGEGDPAPSDEGAIIYTMAGEAESDPAGEEGGDGSGEAGEDSDPVPSDEDGIIYTMTGEDPGSDPAGAGDDGGDADDGGGVPSDKGEIILEPREEADVRGSDGVLLDGQVYYMTTAAGGFGGEPRAADGPADYDRVAAMLAVRGEWPDLSSGACIA